MASWSTLASWTSVLFGLSLSMGCNGEREPFDPPQPYPGGTIGQGAAGGGGGDGGTSAGGTTTTGSGGTTGTPDSLNTCECAFGSVDTLACGNCINDSTVTGALCGEVRQACKTDEGCETLFGCRLACQGKPEAEAITCIQGCYAGVDLSSPDNHAFVNLMTCICNNCAIKCAPPMPITCE